MLAAGGEGRLGVLVERVRAEIEEGAEVHRRCAESLTEAVAQAAELLLGTVREGGRIVLFGNGGSAADAQHLAAELVGRFARERPAIPAVALCADASAITAIGNDYGFDAVFARQVEAAAGKGDAVVAISTSGRSRNVIEGAAAARRAGARVVALTGANGGELARLADVAIRVPSGTTARVQEAHMTIGHVLCALVEEGI